MNKFNIRLRQLRNSKSLSQQQLADAVGMSKSSINMYERGEREPNLELFETFADYFNVDLDYLLGKSDNPRKNLPNNITPVTITDDVVTIPIYGNVAAGQGCYADNDIIDSMEIPKEWIDDNDTYSILKVSGDSMQPDIQDGDFALIRQQTSVDSGSYAVALIDDENGVIKRVLYGTNWIELQSVNPMYAPRRFENEDVQRIRIFGLVKKIIRNYD